MTMRSPAGLPEQPASRPPPGPPGRGVLCVFWVSLVCLLGVSCVSLGVSCVVLASVLVRGTPFFCWWMLRLLSSWSLLARWPCVLRVGYADLKNVRARSCCGYIYIYIYIYTYIHIYIYIYTCIFWRFFAFLYVSKTPVKNSYRRPSGLDLCARARRRDLDY